MRCFRMEIVKNAEGIGKKCWQSVQSFTKANVSTSLAARIGCAWT
jgi:hypothetical protein